MRCVDKCARVTTTMVYNYGVDLMGTYYIQLQRFTPEYRLMLHSLVVPKHLLSQRTDEYFFFRAETGRQGLSFERLSVQ